ncbi:MAG: hypothetical protein H6727_16315 [Myxococcales bacterium]|nr:hypothetical protein [Myxococcales bacterium]
MKNLLLVFIFILWPFKTLAQATPPTNQLPTELQRLSQRAEELERCLNNYRPNQKKSPCRFSAQEAKQKTLELQTLLFAKRQVYLSQAKSPYLWIFVTQVYELSFHTFSFLLMKENLPPKTPPKGVDPQKWKTYLGLFHQQIHQIEKKNKINVASILREARKHSIPLRWKRKFQHIYRELCSCKRTLVF